MKFSKIDFNKNERPQLKLKYIVIIHRCGGLQQLYFLSSLKEVNQIKELVDEGEVIEIHLIRPEFQKSLSRVA